MFGHGCMEWLGGKEHDRRHHSLFVKLGENDRNFLSDFLSLKFLCISFLNSLRS